MSPFFDAHTHPQMPSFGKETGEVIDRALQADVHMILVGTRCSTSQAAVLWANQYESGVYASVGLHPTDAVANDYVDEHEAADMAKGGMEMTVEQFDQGAYFELATNRKVVGIGECGLDYYRVSEETKHTQQAVLIQHLEVAKEVEKPLIIHCRNAFADLVPLLREQRSLLLREPGIIHFFTGSLEDMKQLLELGFAFTFGGVTTFARDYDEVIRYAPKEAILSETDAPYVTPVPHRGKRNEPAYVVEVTKKLAEIRGVSVEEMRAQIYENAQRIFKI